MKEQRRHWSCSACLRPNAAAQSFSSAVCSSGLRGSKTAFQTVNHAETKDIAIWTDNRKTAMQKKASSSGSNLQGLRAIKTHSQRGQSDPCCSFLHSCLKGQKVGGKDSQQWKGSCDDHRVLSELIETPSNLMCHPNCTVIITHVEPDAS